MIRILITTLSISASDSHAGDFIRVVNPIREQYIVVLKNDMPSHSARENHLRGLASSQKATFKTAFKSILNGGVIKMTQAKTLIMARHPSVAYIDWVTTYGVKPAVANMSLGGSKSVALDPAVTKSIQSGVTYAIAVGNSNQDACFSSPARLSEAGAIIVGATTSTDAKATYSNFGK